MGVVFSGGDRCGDGQGKAAGHGEAAVRRAGADSKASDGSPASGEVPHRVGPDWRSGVTHLFAPTPPTDGVWRRRAAALAD